MNESFKELTFFQMMVEMGSVCEKCGSKPSFPDGWYFYVTPETATFPPVCPKCIRGESHESAE